MLDAKVSETQGDDHDCHAEGAPLRNRMGKTAGKGVKHGIQNFCRTHSGKCFDLEWHLGNTKIKSH